jgi:acyl carrier protein
MTASLDAEHHVDLFEQELRQVIGKRIGADGFALEVELTALGIDSLMLLRIIADLAPDPSLEINLEQLADVVTVNDLRFFLVTVNRRDDQR